MRKITKFLLVLLLLSGCTNLVNKPNYMQLSGFTQGTTFSIIYSDTVDYKVQVDSILADFDFSLSLYNKESLLSSINRGESDSVDHYFEECFAMSDTINRESGGLFDPTLAPLIKAYGFGSDGKYRELDSVEFAEIYETVGFSKVRIEGGKLVRQNESTMIDFNAIAQGYSVDVVADFFDSKGVTNYMVEIGGEVFCKGESPRGDNWKIAIDTPKEGSVIPGADIATVIGMESRGLATSGNYRKFLELESGEKLVHTIDPISGHPVSHNLLSVTILAKTAALADGYATACMVGGLEWSKEFVEELNSGADSESRVDCYLIYSDLESGEMKVYSTL